jgi:hypothetical protein
MSRWVCKNRPKWSPIWIYFFKINIFLSWKKRFRILDTSVIWQKTARSNNRPIGENSDHTAQTCQISKLETTDFFQWIMFFHQFQVSWGSSRACCRFTTGLRKAKTKIRIDQEYFPCLQGNLQLWGGSGLIFWGSGRAWASYFRLGLFGAWKNY